MESMIAPWENRDRQEEDSSLHGLLLVIIKSKALNYLAHLRVRLQVEEEINSYSQRELNLRISTLEAYESDIIFDSETRSVVQETLKHMSNQNRQIFILSRYQNTLNKKIVEQLGVSIRSVELHIAKALKILHTKLKDYLASILF